MKLRCYVYVLFELRVCFFSDACFFRNRNTRTCKTAKTRGRSFISNEVELASNCSFSFNTFCINNHSTSHPKSVRKLCRIHDRILLSSETASEDLKIVKIAFPSLRDFIFDGEARTFLLTENKSQNVSILY